jgi:hypothetical protein
MFDKKLKLKLEPVPFEDAAEEYSLEGITHDELSDLFPDDPEHFLVHKGNVVVDGPMKVGYEHGKDELTVYVIDGDLTINGPLVFQQADAYAALFVTGNLTCDNAYIAWTAQLFVKGSMTVKHLLATYIEDAGHFSINGSLGAGSWLECGDRGCFEIGKKPKARLLRVGEHRYYVFGPYAPKDEAPAEDGGAEAEEDPDQKFGFSPKEAVSIKGILHPSLFEGEEDVSTDKIGEAMLKGKPLSADGSGGMTITESKKAAPAKKPAAKTAAPKKAAKPAKKAAAKKKPAKKAAKKPAAKKKTKAKNKKR